MLSSTVCWHRDAPTPKSQRRIRPLWSAAAPDNVERYSFQIDLGLTKSCNAIVFNNCPSRRSGLPEIIRLTRARSPIVKFLTGAVFRIWACGDKTSTYRRVSSRGPTRSPFAHRLRDEMMKILSPPADLAMASLMAARAVLSISSVQITF